MWDCRRLTLERILGYNYNGEARRSNTATSTALNNVNQTGGTGGEGHFLPTEVLHSSIIRKENMMRGFRVKTVVPVVVGNMRAHARTRKETKRAHQGSHSAHYDTPIIRSGGRNGKALTLRLNRGGELERGMHHYTSASLPKNSLENMFLIFFFLCFFRLLPASSKPTLLKFLHNIVPCSRVSTWVIQLPVAPEKLCGRAEVFEPHEDPSDLKCDVLGGLQREVQLVNHLDVSPACGSPA